MLLTSGDDEAFTNAISSSSSSTSMITINEKTLLNALLLLYDEFFTSTLKRKGANRFQLSKN